MSSSRNNPMHENADAPDDKAELLSNEVDIENRLAQAAETPIHVGLFATQLMKVSNSNADHLLKDSWAYCFIIWFFLVNLGVFIGMMIYFTHVACPTGVALISPQWGHTGKTSSKVSKSSGVNSVDMLYPAEQGFHVCATYAVNAVGEFAQPCLFGGMTDCSSYSKHVNCPSAVAIITSDDLSTQQTVASSFYDACVFTQQYFNNCTNFQVNSTASEEYYYSAECIPFSCNSYSEVSVGFVQCYPAEAAFSLASEYTGYAAMIIYLCYYTIRIIYYKGFAAVFQGRTWRLLLISLLLQESVELHNEHEEKQNSSSAIGSDRHVSSHSSRSSSMSDVVDPSDSEKKKSKKSKKSESLSMSSVAKTV